MPSSPDRRQAPGWSTGADPADLLGGHPVLDLVNTLAWRGDPDRTTDRLTDVDALLSWSLTAGVIGREQAEALGAEVAGAASAGPEMLEEARSVRATAYALLRPVARGVRPASTDVRAARAMVVGALSRAEIVDVLPWRWAIDVQTVRDLPSALALQLWQLVQFEDLRRLRECRDRDCGWLFLDRSKNASRVWCSSRDCGNRTRVRRHYQRLHVAREGAVSGPDRDGPEGAA
jgi:predicted RNA-binding Zn ribbon-like protein